MNKKKYINKMRIYNNNKIEQNRKEQQRGKKGEPQKDKIRNWNKYVYTKIKLDKKKKKTNQDMVERRAISKKVSRLKQHLKCA